MARSSWDYKVPDEKNFLKEVPADAKQYPIQWAEMRGGYYMNDGSYDYVMATIRYILKEMLQ